MKQDGASRAFQKARQEKLRQKMSGAFAQGLSLHQRGQIGAAEAVYRQIIAQAPEHFDALHHLGIAASQRGRFEEAEGLIAQALALDPRSAAAWSNRGIALNALKRYDEALACFDQALAIKVDFADAHSNRGNALIALERFDEAATAYDKAIAIDPKHADAFANRGNALKEVRRFDEAVASCDTAIALKPGSADAHSNRGFALMELKRFDEALASFDKALGLNPRLAEAWLGRGNVFFEAKALPEAFAAYEKALALRPDYFKALIQLAQCHGRQGNLAQEIAFYDKALAIRPDFADAISNRIFALDFVPDLGFAEHQAARRGWWRQVGAKIAAASRLSHRNSLDPARRIVLGYVSSDFNRHSAATAFKPVLAHHDKSRFTVICYACSMAEDEITQEFRALADVWRPSAQLSDDRLAAQIQADQVDILVDLSGHSAGNRLGAFARKPAPVQVTAWGHATGTGLETIDYLFSDPVAIPAPARSLFAEAIYDLPCLITMEPPSYDIPPCDPPALARGHVTFGSFNRIGKVSDDALAAWAAILRVVPGSRILMKDTMLDDAGVRALLTQKFAAHGIAAERIELRGRTSREDHLAALKDVDIALDPFPQNGGITTWEALHMGVPVVAKLSNSVPSRLSGAILSAIGLTDWVGDSVEDYCAIAAKYAAMPEFLRELRHALPARISASAAGNSAAYTRVVEAAYRTMWERYVAAHTKAASA